MGIRIHKVIGYGLTDLTIPHAEYDLKLDERFDPNGFFCHEYDDREHHFTMKEFYVQLELLCANDTDFNAMELHWLKHEIKDKKFTDFNNIFVWDAEFGESNVCVFISPTSRDQWYRYDDTIDYYDEGGEHSISTGVQNRVVVMDRPLYPYEGWIDLRTLPPKRADNIITHLRRIVRDSKVDLDLEKLLQKTGFDSIEELKDNIVPMIPNELIEVIRYLKVFKDPNTVYQLRPMIYVYWG